MLTIVALVEKPLTPHDVDRLAHLHDPEPVQVHLLVPVRPAHHGIVGALDDMALGRLGRVARGGEGDVAPGSAEVEVRAGLDASVTALQAAGVEADGSLVQDDPVQAAVAAARRLGAAEVIVLTEPHLVEDTLHRDWASRIRDAVGLPVLHVVAGTDQVVS